MDGILILYSLLFVGVLLFPFAFFYYQKKHNPSFLSHTKEETFESWLQEKNTALANLKDLKAEWETGKLTEEEFRELSKEILLKLEELDSLLGQQNPSLSTIQEKPVRVCPQCNTPRIPNANFCHQCGYSYLTNPVSTESSN